MKPNRWILSILFLLTMNVVVMAAPGFKVTMRGKPLTLSGDPLQKNGALPSLTLPDSGMTPIKLDSFKGKVTIISVVPSIDTAVCEKQTHILSEENGGLDQSFRLVTISRDLPFAQRRFAKEAKIGNIHFLSDYRDAGFGRASGLLIEENALLTRAVMVLDKEGIIRYLEVVPDLGQLPDMKGLFAAAKSLAG